MLLNHILILGAGAVGVLPAAKLLHKSSLCVRVAAEGERLARYRRDGIYLNGEYLPFEYISSAEPCGFAADLVIAATKTYSLRAALESIRPFVRSETILLPFLNGITAQDVVREVFPDSTVLRGLFLGHASVREGNRIVQDGVGTFYFGEELNAVRTEAVENTADLFNDVGISCEVPVSMRETAWKKFILNVGINQTQAYFRADYGAVQRSETLMEFAIGLMREAASVAECEGVSGTSGMIDAAVSVIRSMPPDVKTSMLQDILAGRRTEADSFAGEVCRRGTRHGLSVPLNRQVLERMSEVS